MTGRGEATWAEFAEAIFAEAAALRPPPVAVAPDHDGGISDAGGAPGQFPAGRSPLARDYGVALPALARIR